MKVILVSHVAAGILALIIGLIAMTAKKYSKIHRGSGQCGGKYYGKIVFQNL